MSTALDDRDYRVLALLKEDAWLSYVELGQRVNLSASAVQRRVERMIAGGVIRGARADVALPEAAAVIVFLLAELADESRSALQQFSTTIGANPAVVEAYYVAGESDVVLKLEISDMAAYNRFVETHVNTSPLVRRFKTLTALRSLSARVGK